MANVEVFSFAKASTILQFYGSSAYEGYFYWKGSPKKPNLK